MRKLNLDTEDLRVESFETNARLGQKGTVRAHSGIECSWDCSADLRCPEGSWGDCTSVEGCSYAGCSDSTCMQKFCGCTEGNTACDYSCYSCVDQCNTDASCPTMLHYPGC